MNFRALPKALVLVPVAASVLALAGCSSDSDGNTTTCPNGAPKGGAPEWTVTGAKGKAEITGQTDKTAPSINLTTPFQVDKTQVKTLHEGHGAEVSASTSVNVCYEGVNGRTGQVFDSAYQKGQPAAFSAEEVVPGFGQALTGQKIGSTVAVVITSADGYAQGNPQAGIEAGDTIIFALKILSVADGGATD
ncbi:MAG: FKBP-type peptidyl-prolyl cis-trans isomerase [Gordonia sp. (in: high G+C Gram-positive bacteria)]|uniref:FKBP-type peptidyl-prolyl cis-trans isomerase n=1 Tax=Gordonia sp. (in: high G+C Gram-positive bacteria) TaxID=84139 RepID=UPI0039E4D6E8